MYILVLPVNRREELYYSGSISNEPIFTASQDMAKTFPNYAAVYDTYWDLKMMQNLNVVIGIPTDDFYL